MTVRMLVPRDIPADEILDIHDLVQRSDFGEKSGLAVLMVNGTWVTIYSATMTKLTQVKSITIDLTLGIPTDPEFRISIKPPGKVETVAFPFDDKAAFIDDTEMILSEKVQCPKNGILKVEVLCTLANAAKAQLTHLKVIEMG